MLITNARLINEGQITQGDLLIKHGRIEKIAGSITAPAGVVVHDAKGKLLMPGMIDDQVHFREPGMTHKGHLASESAAAVAGGITSFMEMPNTIPNTTTRAVLADKYALAAGKCFGNYAFYFGGANDNLEEIKRLRPGEAPAVKVFMGASTGNMLVDDPTTLNGIFEHSALPILTHCEDTPTIKANEVAAREKYGEDVPFSEHWQIRSHEACYLSTQLAVGLAKKHKARLHVLHLTTARELEFFSAGPIEGKLITVEACVHHLFLNDSFYAERGPQIKCNPAVKNESDRVALVKAVRDGVIDIIATDHAPHTIAEKAQGFWKCPSGLPLVQYALPVLFALVQRGELTLEQVVQKVCHAPALRFGVVERGFLREGYHADLTLVDLDTPTHARNADVRSLCGWTPFDGMSFPASIAATWVNGALAYDGREVLPVPRGERLICK
ncbi:MAG: dihydroorotase [Pseudomonadota bacterium]